MSLPVQSLLVLGLGATVAAVCIGLGRGAVYLLSLEAAGVIAILLVPLIVLTVAAFAGRGKRAGRGAVAFSWLFLLFLGLMTYSAFLGSPMGSTGPIGYLFLLLFQVLGASAVLAIALLQKPESSSGERADVT
jgi:hypothetical protein